MASILEIDNVKEGDSLVFDIESSGLLDETAIDYNSSPYRLRDSFQIWCVVVKDLETDAILTFVGDEIKTQLPIVMKKAGTIIAHNGINFDLLATKLYLGLDYTVSRGLDQSDTFCGKDVSIVDTLCWSKALNPDRLGGHSLDEWGNRVGYNKINWRKEAIDLGLIKASDPKGAEFGQYHPKMLEYCLTPDHKVLTEDLRWEEIGNLAEGDNILGFDEYGPNRKYKTAKVESWERKPAPVYKVTLASGKEFRTTANHKWLVARSRGKSSIGVGSYDWVETQNLRFGGKYASKIPVFLNMDEEDFSKESGWLAGMFDGEGCLQKKPFRITVAQRPTKTLTKLEHILSVKNVPFSKRYVKESGDCCSLALTGNCADKVEFLIKNRPERLIEKFNFEDMGRLENKRGVDEVVNVEYVGIEDIVVMQTSTRTFISEGYPMHNCIRDVEVTELTFKALIAERGDWPWDDALNLEQAVMDIITRQSHRGFWFDKTLAEANVHELDELMEAARIKVEPILPAKPLTKTLEKLYTPPKVQVKKDGTLSAAIVKWVDKHEGKVLDDRTIEVFGTTYSIPMPQESIVKEQPAKMKDTTHIKGWLVSMGWEPINWKERDLSVDTKKQKLSPEKLEETIQRYVEQTLNSPFCDARCEFLDTTPDMLLHKLRSGKPGRGLKVRTNPSFTVGQDKEICPNLDAMKEKFPYTQDIVNFLTYQHRRNSILGGGYDPDDDEEEFDKGYLANVRSDGRIATPADTCGAGTSRFKHKGVANIPRVTSLYGDKMRAMFGVERAKMIQFGYDFDSLEAKIEAHYTYKYDDANKTYGVSLIAEKPNDIHSVTAKKISLIIHKEFSRANAKSVKYGLR